MTQGEQGLLSALAARGTVIGRMADTTGVSDPPQEK